MTKNICSLYIFPYLNVKKINLVIDNISFFFLNFNYQFNYYFYFKFEKN